MGQDNLVEKLSHQAESFQDEFVLLSKSSSLKEMAGNFARLVKGNFLLKDVYIFFKDSFPDDWQQMFTGYPQNAALPDYLNKSQQLKLNYFEGQPVAASINLPLGDGSFLGILLSGKLDGAPFNDFDKITLHVLIQVFDSAYNTFLNQKKQKKLIFDLNEKILQLNNLIDTGIELSRFEKRDILFELALERATSITNASSGLIKILDENGSEQNFTFPRGLDAEDIQSGNYKIESSFRHQDKIYTFILSEKETRGGVTSFNDLDVLLLQSITRQVSASIENEYLLNQSIEKEKIERELSVAASIQQRIIPKELPSIKGYEIAGINIPSKEVGGDYFDCIPLENGRTAFIIADVAGKGISAALLVNTLNAALYSYLDFNLTLTDLSDKLNKLIYKSSPSDKFITFFIAVLDPESGELDIVNAGHNPILLHKHDKTLIKIEAGGVGLGMFDFGIPFTGEKLKMDPGDKLFLYTDGIPEAMSETEEEYSDEKMISFFLDHSDKDTKDFINILVEDVKIHVGTAPQSDDITALILKRI